MRAKGLFIGVVVLLIALLPLVGLFVHQALAQTSGCTTTATVKCLYTDKPGDCGSCTCQGVGVNGKCGIKGWDPAGCMCNLQFTKCHECNAPGGGGGGGGGEPIPE
jgi:hypothetical protein